MQIVHVVENLERGGLERMVIDLAILQKQAGHQVEVCCLFDLGALAEELAPHGIPVHACGKGTAGTFAALRTMRRRLAPRRGAVLHTHNATAHYHAVLALLGIPFARILNTRHGMVVEGAASRRERFYRRSLWRTDAVVAVCDAARLQLLETGVRPRGDVLAIPNGIRLHAFGPASSEARDALVAELGLEPGSRLIGTVGRLTPVKNQEMLLRAFAGVRQEVSNAALVVVGGGPLHDGHEALARSLGVEKHVRFLGDRGDVRRLLRGFDVFALSSRSEGYSIALLEASAVGLPIVATDVGGNREIVGEGHTGHLVTDEATLTSRLSGLLNRPDHARSMGANARRWAEIEASLETMAERYTRLYAGVA